MNKMTVIQLLNKIANGEEVPKKIKWTDITFYYNFDIKGYYDKKGKYELFNSFITDRLNDEVEIIKEDKKIEKIKWKSNVEHLKQVDTNTNEVIDKINEIIDYINKGE